MSRFNSRPRFDKPKEGLYVAVREGEDFARALRRFKKKVANEGIIQLYREKTRFVKPSEKRRLAKKAGRKRWEKKKAQLENQ
jgi:ribosomal protein S21